MIVFSKVKEIKISTVLIKYLMELYNDMKCKKEIIILLWLFKDLLLLTCLRPVAAHL